MRAMSFAAFAQANKLSPFGAAANGASQAQIEKGPDLEEIQTENLGFLSLARDTKLKLLSTQWPDDALPAPTASLLSIASTQGLLAVAGPSELIVASTDSVRKAFTSKTSGSDGASGSFKSFTPELRIDMPMRISQVAFTADEKYLVVSAESGGGLAIYSVQQLKQGNKEPAFQISTEGESLRALVPNPTTEKSPFLALVTNNGNLLVVNVDTQKFVSGSKGPILKSGVSCVTWSTKGKQLVAGLGDGTAYQLTPEGEGKAEIPRPPGLSADQHVASISWLNNDVFLTMHCPSSSGEMGADDPWTFHLITRQKSSFGFQAMTHPIFPAINDLRRSPSHFFTPRLREFPPNLKDVIIVASTMSADIGLITKSDTPLSSDLPASSITGVYTTTSPANDSRRAQVPSDEEGEEASPIGLALDFSSKNTVPQPIPGEEIDNSATPLPALLSLTTKGHLAAWWFVYNDSVRGKTFYPGLIASPGMQGSSNGAQMSPAIVTPKQSTPAFGQSSFGSPSVSGSAFGSSATPTSGSQTTGSAFGSTPAFGAPSALGGNAFGSSANIGIRASPWGSSNAATTPAAPAFGQTAFGQQAKPAASAFGSAAPAFGNSGGLGSRSSPWGAAKPSTSTSTQQATGVFGSGTGGGSSGFGSYASSGGFGAVATSQPSESIFSKPSTSSFSSENKPSSETSFGTFGKPATQATSIFGNSQSTPFKLGSTFKADATAKENEPAPSSGGGFFSSGFGKSLLQPENKAEPSVSKDAEMESEEEPAKQEPEPPKSSIFGASDTKPSPFSIQSARSAPEKTAASIPSPPVERSIKIEPRSGSSSPVGVDRSIPEAPLPPDTTSRAAYGPGDSSASSTGTTKVASDDAPLPPDFTVRKQGLKAQDDTEDAPLPPDFTKASQVGEDAPLPPDFTNSTKDPKANSTQLPKAPLPVEDAPLPPDFTAPQNASKEPPSSPGLTEEEPSEDAENEYSSEEGSLESKEEAPLPPDFVVPKLPSRSTVRREESDLPEDHEEPFDEEGSGEDIAKEFSSDLTPESSFAESSFMGGSPVGGRFTHVPRPNQSAPRSGGSLLFGEVGGASVPQLPPPSKEQESPRSPSPVRSKGKQAAIMPPPTHRSQMTSRVSIEEQLQRDRLLAAQAKAKQEEEDQQKLLDEQDDAIRAELSSEVEPSRELREFIAHQDYVGQIDKPGIPGQVERVYRDINSMIDTLGLNARSIEAFIQGNMEDDSSDHRTRDDLYHQDEWLLQEVYELADIENTLTEKLDADRLRDIEDLKGQCREFEGVLGRLRPQLDGVNQLLQQNLIGQGSGMTNSMPLSLDQGILIHDLRRSFSKLQENLSKVEEELAVLQARINASDKSSSQRPTPTVETVKKTITKMTSIIEKRSGDVDVLESQMKRLGLAVTPTRTDSPRATFHTPNRFGASTRTPGSAAESQPFFTPQSRFGTPSRSGGFRASIGPLGTPTTQQKKLNGVTAEDVTRLRAKQKARQAVAQKLQEAVLKAGPRVRYVNEL